MLERERADGTPLAHPTVIDLTGAAGVPLFACTVTGAVTLEPPPALALCRGGFFCDEPVSHDPAHRPAAIAITAW